MPVTDVRKLRKLSFIINKLMGWGQQAVSFV